MNIYHISAVAQSHQPKFQLWVLTFAKTAKFNFLLFIYLIQGIVDMGQGKHAAGYYAVCLGLEDLFLKSKTFFSLHFYSWSGVHGNFLRLELI